MILCIETEQHQPRGWFATLPRQEQRERVAQYRMCRESLKQGKRKKMNAIREQSLRTRARLDARGAVIDGD